MDTSDSDYSDVDDANYDWEKSMKRRHGRKRVSKAKGRSSMMVVSDGTNSTNCNLDSSGEGVVLVNETITATTTSVCCSCSRSSYCKTTKCQCRASGGACGLSCGCRPSKCANRGSKSERDESIRPDSVGDVRSGSENDATDEESRDLVSHGARLLQNALAERRPSEAPPAEDGGAKRKPLSDIGNTVVCFHSPYWLEFVSIVSYSYNNYRNHCHNLI